MIKPKSHSLMLAEPLAEQLRDHITQIEQRQYEIIQQKLQRQQQIDERVNALEKEFVSWADRKEEAIRQKIQKSTKNKEDHINKIVKKCQNHEKFIGEKLKIFKTKKRDNLKQAWKKTEQFNHNLEDYHTSKQLSKDRSAPKFRTEQNVSQSRLIDKQQINYDKDNQKQYLSISYNNASKYLDNTSKYMGNVSKEYWGELNQSIRQLKATQMMTTEIQNQQKNEKIDLVHNRLKQTLVRFKQFSQIQQQQKIQQLGQRLQKIQKTRMKKLQLHKKKSPTNQNTIQLDEHQRRPAGKKPNQNRSQRMNSESAVRQRRVQDWAEPNKNKREEIFQTKLQNGNEYLQYQKLKFLKTSLARKIAGSAIQKKLYFERLNH